MYYIISYLVIIFNIHIEQDMFGMSILETKTKYCIEAYLSSYKLKSYKLNLYQMKQRENL